MKMNGLLKGSLILFAFLLVVNVQSQPMADQMSENYRKAYQVGTRSADGNPGPNYWINHASYDIDVEVTPATGLISGKATILYTNNSPDTLQELVFRLYQDIYKKGNARQFVLATSDLTDGVQVTSLAVDGQTLDTKGNKVSRSATNMTVQLQKPLFANQTAEVKIEWNFVMPQQHFIRIGQYRPEHLFAGYWYPQTAVYDDIDGWDRHEYQGMVEFYNDHNDFSVNITVPGGFASWATGVLQNPAEVLGDEKARLLEKAADSDAVYHIIEASDYNELDQLQPGGPHTWKFKADLVPDFAFAVSSIAVWDATSAVVDLASGRRVLISAVYPPGLTHYEKVADITREAVQYMSFEWPGVPFPYPRTTVFASGLKTGGMEFPMIANDGAPDDLADLQGLTFHEVFHNYFPFSMGTNERKYAFMDEGWAHYFPTGFLAQVSPGYVYLQNSIRSYAAFAGSENELPPIIPTYILNDYASQRMAAYQRPAVAYHLLRQELGDEVFGSALREYVRRWRGKHPMPYDFFATFDQVSGESLEWFWRPWFFEHGRPDLAVKPPDDGNIIRIQRLGIMPVPVYLQIDFTDGTSTVIEEKASVWKEGMRDLEIVVPAQKTIEKLELGNEWIPDSNPANNKWQRRL
ncbi:MAG TPA: M1 family metallopeptidase [Bacteroidales bacterium]|nr:M1 family metallopeptidase [Bacteroidales bacterium]